MSLPAAGARAVLPFPYKANVARMGSAAPDWPRPTDDISELEVDIKFRPRGLWQIPSVGNIAGRLATLRLKITDYPGEWLLDLPLLQQDFISWSRATVDRCRSGLRGQLAKEWLDFIAWHGHDEAADGDVAKRAHDLYRTFLGKAKHQHGLSYLQPGRFVCLGSLGELECLWFSPLDLPPGVEKTKPGSLAALMESRYETYKKTVVEGFVRDHFRHFNRQIVVVDVLRALLAGPDAFEDAQSALEDIIRVYKFGSGNRVAALFGPRIDKVLFAATKADHVTGVQRDHLAELLRSLIRIPEIQARSGSAYTEAMAIASVLSTEDDTDIIGNHRVDVVVGRPVGKEKRVKFFPGPIPARRPRADFWSQHFFDIPVFQPPPFDGLPVDGIPHINLDAATEFLLGDRLG